MAGIQAKKCGTESLPAVNIAIFGLGNIGSLHLGNFKGNTRAHILYYVEGSQERINAFQNKFQNFVEPEATFLKPSEEDKVFSDKRIDAVIICTPNFTHEHLVLKSLESGKAVFCEKPLALTEEGIERCLEAVKKYKKPLQTGFNRRFDPGLRCLKTRIDSGEIGKVQVIKMCSRDYERQTNEYLKIAGGIFHDSAVHDIDYVCWIAGEYPESLSAFAHAHLEDMKEMGEYDTVGIMMKFPSGTIAILDLSRCAVYGYDQRVEVFGNKGMLTNGEQRPYNVKFHNEKGTTAVPILSKYATRYRESYVAEMEHFLNVCQGLEECEISPESVLAVSKIATACGKVANTGKNATLNLN